MNFNEIQELIRLVNKSNLTEFKLKDKDFEVVIRTKQYTKGGEVVLAPSAPVVTTLPAQAVHAPAISAPAPAAVAAPAPPQNTDTVAPAAGKRLVEIKSPIVGTFYRSPGPDKAVFVKVGDAVSAGSVVCIIEAMKLFNEIESDVTGTIVKVLVEDASPVEYDQVLFLVEV
jgi:acetyl-CoA carboxylase biotin carboxyl carrier protein